MLNGRIPRILAIGLIWGAIEALLILWIFPPGTPYRNAGLTLGINNPRRSSLDLFQHSYFLTLAGLVLCLVAGLGLLVGHFVNEYQPVGRAFGIGQLTSGTIVIGLIGSIGLLFVGLLVTSFFLGIFFGIVGVLLRERMLPLGQISLDWRLSSLGLLSQALIIPVPLFSQQVFSGRDEAVIPPGGSIAIVIISILVIVGVVAAVLGVTRRKITSSNLAGVLVIGSFVLGVGMLTCIGFTAPLADPGIHPSPLISSATQLFQVITILLILSLIVPATVSIRCLSPRRILSEKR